MDSQTLSMSMIQSLPPDQQAQYLQMLQGQMQAQTAQPNAQGMYSGLANIGTSLLNASIANNYQNKMANMLMDNSDSMAPQSAYLGLTQPKLSTAAQALQQPGMLSRAGGWLRNLFSLGGA